MKKRTAAIAFAFSLMPVGQPLLIGTAAALTSVSSILAAPKKAMAEDAVFYYNQGQKKYQSKDYSGAISDYTKAIEIKPNYAPAYNNRGAAKYKLNDFYGAVSDYNKALKIDPKDPRAFTNRGSAKRLIGDKKGACSDWRKASSLGSKNAAKFFRKDC